MHTVKPLTRRVRIKVFGRVQGVGFRWFVKSVADSCGIFGWVRNKADGSVEAEAQGPSLQVDGFLEHLKTGHLHSRVDSIETEEMPTEFVPARFDILRI